MLYHGWRFPYDKRIAVSHAEKSVGGIHRPYPFGARQGYLSALRRRETVGCEEVKHERKGRCRRLEFGKGQAVGGGRSLRRFYNRLRLRKALHRSGKRGFNGGIQRSEQGKEFVANLIALKGRVGVRRVGAKCLSFGMEVVFYVGATQLQEGANDVTVLSAHAAKTFKSRTAHKVEQQGFYIIVAVMRHGNRGSAELLTEFLKIVVAQFARRHLNADALLLGVILRLEMRYIERHSSLLAKPTHKRLVGIRFLATQLKIAMRRHKGLPQAEES